jgi:hypothetical protein
VRGQPLRDPGRVQLLCDGETADHLLRPLPRLDADHRDELKIVLPHYHARSGLQRQLEIAVRRQPQQATCIPAVGPHLRDLDVLARMSAERELVVRQIADRRLVGRHRPSDAGQLRDRVGAFLHGGGGLADGCIQLGGGRTDVFGRGPSSEQEDPERAQQPGGREDEAKAPFHGEARTCPSRVSRTRRAGR